MVTHRRHDQILESFAFRGRPRIVHDCRALTPCINIIYGARGADASPETPSLSAPKSGYSPKTEVYSPGLPRPVRCIPQVLPSQNRRLPKTYPPLSRHFPCVGPNCNGLMGNIVGECRQIGAISVPIRWVRGGCKVELGYQSV